MEYLLFCLRRNTVAGFSLLSEYDHGCHAKRTLCGRLQTLIRRSAVRSCGSWGVGGGAWLKLRSIGILCGSAGCC